MRWSEEEDGDGDDGEKRFLCFIDLQDEWMLLNDERRCQTWKESTI